MIYINPYLGGINTIIGGVASTISTKSLLAAKLGISEITISRFEIKGSDIHAYINSTYVLPGSVFEANTSITSYLDMGNKCTSFSISGRCFYGCINMHSAVFNAVAVITQNAFYQCPLSTRFEINSATDLNRESLRYSNFKTLPTSISYLGINAIWDFNGALMLDFPLVTNIAASFPIAYSSTVKEIYLINLTSITPKSNAFRNLTACELISMRKLSAWAGPANVLNAFTLLKLNCVIEVNIALATANAGSADAALLWAKNNRSAIVKFYDGNGNYVSTL